MVTLGDSLIVHSTCARLPPISGSFAVRVASFFPENSRIGISPWEIHASQCSSSQRLRRFVPRSSSGSSSSNNKDQAGPFRGDPYEVLGVPYGSSQEDAKAAFRAKIKDFHPDVYRGEGDAQMLTRQLIRAYELVVEKEEELQARYSPRGRKRSGGPSFSSDPFSFPEQEANALWVNEFRCVGRACSYSCVVRAPSSFSFSKETGRAQAIEANEPSLADEDAQYLLNLAVGQCPEQCIHYVTPQQRNKLQGLLDSVVNGEAGVEEVFPFVVSLIAQATFENNRYDSPKRTPREESEYVDWF